MGGTCAFLQGDAFIVASVGLVQKNSSMLFSQIMKSMAYCKALVDFDVGTSC